MFRERNNCPRIGISPIPGTLLSWACVRLSRRPAIPNDCPSLNSSSVSARRVEMAGIANPEIASAFAKSNVLTSGATWRRIVPSLDIVPVKSSFTPKGLNEMLTAGKKRGLLPIQRDQIRFRQDLQNAPLLQILNDGAEVDVRPE